MSDSLQLHGLYSPWNPPGQNTRVRSHSLLQGIFPTQGSNPGLPLCRWILYPLNHQGSQINLPVVIVVTKSCPTLCDPMDCSIPGFPVLHHLPELAQIHVHWVGDAIQHPTLVPFSCLQSFPASESFPTSWLFASSGKVLELQLQHQSFWWIFRTDFI